MAGFDLTTEGIGTENALVLTEPINSRTLGDYTETGFEEIGAAQRSVAPDFPRPDFEGVCKISRDALIRSCCTTRFICNVDAESKPGLLLSRLITAEGGFVDFSILHYDKEIVAGS
jgi:hypothetical protein